MKKSTKENLFKVLIAVAGVAGVGVGIHAANKAWQKHQEQRWLETESRHCRIGRK